ncbi:uncharacterized protein LOC116290502 [Actinia tenebrosa]|uniref:Uncharacterized protein LOC116290502 n=1 Tax=Actinia tenebrosa TaxID=6105 RepID=A0A6P8HCN8_ACTTE|nr:uncharacterized protein LOC116290502 [Actinia tenebrosa]
MAAKAAKLIKEKRTMSNEKRSSTPCVSTATTTSATTTSTSTSGDNTREDNFPSLGRPQKSREPWSAEDTLKIQTKLRHLIKMSSLPSRLAIREQFKSSVPSIWGRQSTKEWQDRCVEKVRSLWKKDK